MAGVLQQCLPSHHIWANEHAVSQSRQDFIFKSEISSNKSKSFKHEKADEGGTNDHDRTGFLTAISLKRASDLGVLCLLKMNFANNSVHILHHTKT